MTELETKIHAYTAWKEKILKETPGEHFRHITGHLLFVLRIADKDPDMVRATGQEPEQYVQSILHALDTYKALIETNPESRAGECQKTFSGYFPDIPSTGDTGIEDYVTRAAQRLQAHHLKK